MGELLHLYISPSHNFFGHHGQPPGDAPILEVDHLDCVAGRGIRNDRFFDFKPDYHGQITFFEHEIYRNLSKELRIFDKSPSVFRRNVITSCVNLTDLFDAEFTIQGIRFRGMGECKPCHWMDLAFGPGAEKALLGHGGLRAVILSSGPLRPGKI